MAELTKEQLDRAIDSYESIPLLGDVGTRGFIRRCLIAAAPYLQLPWDEPTEKELFDAKCGWGIERPFAICEEMRQFVRIRNAALLPKPVDPRREKIEEILSRHVKDGADQTIDRILAVLNEVKPDDSYQNSLLYPDTNKMPQPRRPLQPNQADWQKP